MMKNIRISVFTLLMHQECPSIPAKWGIASPYHVLSHS